MSGVEVVALVATILSAIRIMPEIPRVWRRVFPRRKKASQGNTGVVVRNHRDMVNPRTGSHTHVDRELEIRQSDNQRITVSETVRTIGKIHDNQTMAQLGANQLHSINSENTARALEASLDTLQDVVRLGYRQAEHQRTVWICCMVIVAYLAYLLGKSTGEISSLKAALLSHLDI